MCGCTRVSKNRYNTKASFADTRMKQIHELMQAQFAANEPGAAILILQGDSLLLAEGYGLSDMQTKRPMTVETNCCLASISKQFTAIGILQLCEAGRMSLQDEVRMYFPQLTDPIWDGVTVAHLLSHSSGIPDARRDYPREEKITADDNKSVAYMDTLTWRRFAPGEAYEYINPTFVLAGKIIEKVSGEEFSEYMRKHIFAKAHMPNTMYFTPENEPLIKNMAHGYEWVGDEGDENGLWSEYDYGEETFFATRPDGALYTSVWEFALWEKALRAGTLVSREWAEKAWTPMTYCTGSPYESYNVRENTYYGLGWFIEPAYTDSITGVTHPKVIYHTGENGGFHNIAARYPEQNVLVVILSTRPDWNQYEMLQKLEDILGL